MIPQRPQQSFLKISMVILVMSVLSVALAFAFSVHAQPAPALESQSTGTVSFRVNTNLLDFGEVNASSILVFNVSLTNLGKDPASFQVSSDPQNPFFLSFLQEVRVPGNAMINVTFTLHVPDGSGVYVGHVWIEPLIDSGGTGSSSLPRTTITLVFRVPGVYLKSFTVSSVPSGQASSIHAIIENAFEWNVTVVGNLTVTRASTGDLVYDGELPLSSVRGYSGLNHDSEFAFTALLPVLPDDKYLVHFMVTWDMNSSLFSRHGFFEIDDVFYVETTNTRVQLTPLADSKNGFQLLGEVQSSAHVPVLLQSFVQLIRKDTGVVEKSFTWAEFVTGNYSFVKLIRAETKGEYLVSVTLHYASSTFEKTYDYFQAVNLEPSVQSSSSPWNAILPLVLVALLVLVLLLIGFIWLRSRRHVKSLSSSLRLRRVHVMLVTGEGLASIDFVSSQIRDMSLRLVAKVYGLINTTEVPVGIIIPFTFEGQDYYVTRIDSLLYILEGDQVLKYNKLEYLPAIHAFLSGFHEAHASKLMHGLVDIDIAQITRLGKQTKVIS